MTLHRLRLVGVAALGFLRPLLPVDAAGPPLATETDRTLYALRLSIAESSERFDLTEAELELVVQSMAEGVPSRLALVKTGPYRSRIDRLASARTERDFRDRDRLRSMYRAKQQAAHPDTVTLPSRGNVIPLQEGSGPRPGPSDTVRIKHVGSLADGTMFCRTELDESVTVRVSDAAIPCLAEGLIRMRAGAALHLNCPPERTLVLSGGQLGLALLHKIELLKTMKGTTR